MSNKISYNQALNKIAFLERRVILRDGNNKEIELSCFNRSLILTYLFDVPKDKTLDDLLNKRRGVKSE